MKKRIPELDFIKGIAIILVIIGHVISQVWNNEPEVYENVFQIVLLVPYATFRVCQQLDLPHNYENGYQLADKTYQTDRSTIYFDDCICIFFAQKKQYFAVYS